MPTPVRPSTTPFWGGTQVEPTTPQKTTGFVPNFRPPAEWHNFLFGDMYSWILWLDYITQTFLIPNKEFDWSVGTGGTHADINALMADSNVVPGNKILVTTPQTLTATQVISKNDLTFVFKPSAVYSKGIGGSPGISITANRVTIRDGRFTAFSTGGDIAISLSGASKNCLIEGIRFASCDTAVADAGANNTLANIIEEV